MQPLTFQIMLFIYIIFTRGLFKTCGTEICHNFTTTDERFHNLTLSLDFGSTLGHFFFILSLQSMIQVLYFRVEES